MARLPNKGGGSRRAFACVCSANTPPTPTSPHLLTHVRTQSRVQVGHREQGGEGTATRRVPPNCPNCRRVPPKSQTGHWTISVPDRSPEPASIDSSGR